MDEADKSLEFYDKLYNSIPSIGFLSQKKRIAAYIKITDMTQKMVDDEQISEENALFLLSILVGKCSSFQKSTMMVALNLPKFNKKRLKPIGFKYANDFRCNLMLLPVEDDNPASS